MKLRKNIKILSVLLLLVIVVVFAFELYLWQSHNYSPHYRAIQKCIEVSPLSDEEQKSCDLLMDKAQ